MTGFTYPGQSYPGGLPVLGTAIPDTPVNPGVGALTLTGYAPTVLQTQSAQPDAGTIALTGYAPDIAQPIAVGPDVGTLTITGYAPAVSQASGGQDLSPDAGLISITGYAPTVEQTGAPQEQQSGGWAGTIRPVKPAPKRRPREEEEALHLLEMV